MANIMIVDDSRTSRKILREILENAGHNIVAECVNGEEGYLQYKELHPDLVTMDITMPKLDGLEALQLIKKIDSEARVVMITAAGQREKMVRAIKCGAAEFISKPYESQEVQNIIEKVLEA